MQVVRHSKTEAVRFDARWRAAVKTLVSRRATHELTWALQVEHDSWETGRVFEAAAD